MTYWDILKYFLHLGTTGFGGPIILIQQMRKDLVEIRKELIVTDFDRAFTLVKAMPGPVAFQMAVFCGGQVYNPEKTKKLGFWGGAIAGFGILFPAFLMMIALAIFYQTLMANPYIAALIQGSKYAVAAIILLSLFLLAKQYLKSGIFWVITVASFALYFSETLPETVIILGFGLLLALLPSKFSNAMNSLFFISTLDSDRFFQIFKTCFTAGAVVFGTGLAAFPMLESVFVRDLGWMDAPTFNAALTFGQMTPGPVTIATTFMGYKMAGIYGAILATGGMMIPPFIHISTWFPKALMWLSRQKWVESFILGATAAVVGCIAVTLYYLNQANYADYSFWIIFFISLFVGVRFKKIAYYKIFVLGALLNLVLTFWV